jgi:REP element-mobilizing transposase RayT
MARRPRVFARGLLYHVIARGNHQEPVFLGPADYHAYLTRLARYGSEHGVVLHAYCLMPNHVHLLVQVGEVPLGRFMQPLQQSYTQRFNRLYEKAGHLFQGRYRAIVCDRESYLLSLVRYIHLNPVRAGLAPTPGDYAYSSHRTYLAGRSTDLADPRLVLATLGGPSRYAAFMGQADAGEAAAEIDARLGEPRPGPGARAVAASPHPPPPPSSAGPGPAPRAATAARQEVPEGLLAALAGHLAVDLATLRSPNRAWRVCHARALVAHALVRRLGYGVSQVAAALGRDASTVSQLVWRAARLSPDAALPAGGGEGREA